jgi:hypothetical protein
MTEGSNHFPQIESDEELENAAVVGAAAVQRLIADRNRLRAELAASKAAQERLHQRYVELGKTVLSLLQQFDITMREAMAGSPDSAVGEAANTAKKFDSHGLPLVPQPSGANGANGHHNGHQLPVEP